MSSEQPVNPLPRHPKVWMSRLRWRWPFLVWLAVLALALWLYNRGGEYIRINGVVEIVTESVSPMQTGRLIEIDVLVGDEVEAGQVVARMDPSRLEEEMSVLSQRIEQQQAEDERQYLSSRQRVLEELRGYQLEEDETRARLKVLEAEAKRIEALESEGLIQPSDRLDLLVDREVARRRLVRLGQIIEDLESERVRIESLRDRIFFSHNDTGPARSRLNLLQQEIDNTCLRAQQAGIVADIRREPGEIVDEGQRVLDIITNKDPKLIAFMDETDTRPISLGDVVEVEQPVDRVRFQARVAAISPNVISLPDRASPIPNRVVRCRRIELEPVEDVDLTPGAAIVVYLPRNQVLWQSLIGKER